MFLLLLLLLLLPWESHSCLLHLFLFYFMPTPTCSSPFSGRSWAAGRERRHVLPDTVSCSSPLLSRQVFAWGGGGANSSSAISIPVLPTKRMCSLSGHSCWKEEKAVWSLHSSGHSNCPFAYSFLLDSSRSSTSNPSFPTHMANNIILVLLLVWQTLSNHSKWNGCSWHYH